MSDEAHSHGDPAPESPGHGGAAATSPSPAAPFTDAEVVAMHAEDRGAAANIVILMTAIFTAGVMGYLIVGYVCSQG